MDCIFCKIINGEIPSRTVFEDDEFKVFLDAFPSAYGHTLIVPKKHYDNIFQIEEDAAGRLFSLAVKVAKAMEKAGYTQINLLQNNGADAGQTVNHFHVHLIPRQKSDTIKMSWETLKYQDGEDDKVARNIAEGLCHLTS